MTNTTSPRIYVACLASYNAGKLHGEWIDADQDEDEDAIHEEIAAMLRASPCPNVTVSCPECSGFIPTEEHPESGCEACGGKGQVPSAEEWAIHDHENFEGIKISEHSSIEDVSRHARMLSEHDGAWAAYVNLVGDHYATEDGFSDAYRGEYQSAEESCRDCGMLDGDEKNPLLNYIDWERFARDMEHDGYSFVLGGIGVYVFSNS